MKTPDRLLRCACICAVTTLLALIVGLGEAACGIVVAVLRAVRDGARMVKEVTAEAWADR